MLKKYTWINIFSKKRNINHECFFTLRNCGTWNKTYKKFTVLDSRDFLIKMFFFFKFKKNYRSQKISIKCQQKYKKKKKN